MELPLEGNGARLWVLLGSIAVAGLLIWQAGEIWLANHLVQSQSTPKIERGIRLIPGNADAWDRLGRARQWDLMDPDPSSSIIDYKRAVEREPTSPYYWMDLGSAYEDARDINKARAAFQKAEDVYPASADVAWHDGNFLLREGGSSDGIKEIAKAVRIDPTLLSQAISRVWRSTGDLNLVVDQLLPADLDSCFEALDVFNSAHQPDAALLVWHRAIALGKPFPLKRSFPFIDELIHDDRSKEAEAVWFDALKASVTPQEMPTDGSVVWDGSFKQPFSYGGLGWRWEPPLGVAIDFDAPRQGAGTHSVRLDFGGSTNLELNEPRQYVPVEPNHTYDFRGYLRTERISTESGLRFSIIDPNHVSQVNILTDNLTGTNGWTEVATQVQTGPDTHFLAVQVYRTPSRLFDNKLSGTAWIADISLSPSSSGEKESK